MSLHTAEAIVLEVRDLQEKDRIVVFLTRERGQLRGVARGARRKHSRFAGQLQPLAKVVVTWYEKDNRELVRVSGVDIIRPASRLQTDLEGILLGAYLAEHMTTFAPENLESDLYFRLLDATLAALVAGVDRDLAARYFEAWVLRLAGIFPPPVQCPLCGRPLEGAAVLPAGFEGLVCRKCSGSEVEVSAGRTVYLGPGELEFLARIGRESLPKMAERPPEPGILRRIEALTTRVRRDFLQGELKSHRVMEQTLGGAPDPNRRRN